MPLTIAMAARAAELSASAYHLDDGGRDHTMGARLLGRLHNGSDRHRGYVAVDDQAAYVVFRGSKTRADWKDNLDLSPSKLNLLRGAGLMVHGGFEDILNATWDSLMAVLDTMPAPPSGRLVVCGHSLGGALAALTALCLAGSRRLNVVPEVYTFGAPYVGNREFADTYNAILPDTLRVVHERDPVPRLDPGYGAHVGKALKLTAQGGRVSAPVGVMNELMVWFYRRYRDVAQLVDSDHGYAHYMAATSKAAKRGLAL